MPDFDRQLPAPPPVTEADSAALRGRGFGDAETFGIADLAALFSHANRVAHAMEVMRNAGFHGLRQ